MYVYLYFRHKTHRTAHRHTHKTQKKKEKKKILLTTNNTHAMTFTTLETKHVTTDLQCVNVCKRPKKQIEPVESDVSSSAAHDIEKVEFK